MELWISALVVSVNRLILCLWLRWHRDRLYSGMVERMRNSDLQQSAPRGLTKANSSGDGSSAKEEVLDSCYREETTRPMRTLLIDFLLHTAVKGGRAPDTLEMRLASIKSAHISIGFRDPLEQKPRLMLVMAGLRSDTPLRPGGCQSPPPCYSSCLNNFGRELPPAPQDFGWPYS